MKKYLFLFLILLISSVSAISLNQIINDCNTNYYCNLSVGNNTYNNTYINNTYYNGSTDHGTLTGLADDDHTQYINSSGRTGGQTINGGLGTTPNNLRLNLNGGYVGINQTTPTFPLDIFYPRNGQSGIQIINPSAGTDASAIVSYKNSGTTTAFTGLMGVNRVLYGTLAPTVMAVYSDNVAGITTMVDAVGNITFATSSSDRMKIYSDGDVKIGYSYLSVLPSYLFSIAKSYTNVFNPATPEGVLMSIENPDGNAAGRGAGMRFHLSGDRVAVMGTITDAANTYADYVFLTYHGGADYITALKIISNGTINIPLFGAGTVMSDALGNLYIISDEKYKSNIKPYTSSILTLNKINPICYNFNSQSGLDQNYTYCGWSAENLLSAVPEAVFSKPDIFYNGTLKKTSSLSVSDRPITALLVNTVKEQQKEIDDLTLRIEKLEAKKL